MDYNKICEFEAMETEKRFLPYTVGTPSFERTANDQYQRLNLIFFTDSHVDMPWCVPEACDNVERTIDFANNFPVPFDAVLYGGDTITFFGHVEKTLAKERFKCLVDRVKKCEAPFIFARGNHDPNHVNNLPENYLRDEDYSEIYLDYSEEKDGIVRQTKANGQKSIWHYKDLEDKKVRIISLDSEDSDRSRVAENGDMDCDDCVNFSNEQLNWLANEALNFDDKEEKDWGVIFVTHRIDPRENEFGSTGERLLEICEAFNNAKEYSVKYENDNAFYNLDINADFTRYASLEKKPFVICFFMGHHHTDNYEESHGIQLIWSLHGCVTDTYSDARVIRRPNTATQNAFDCVSIDLNTRKIRIVRYGAGVSCYGKGGDRFLPDGLDF